MKRRHWNHDDTGSTGINSNNNQYGEPVLLCASTIVPNLDTCSNGSSTGINNGDVNSLLRDIRNELRENNHLLKEMRANGHGTSTASSNTDTSTVHQPEEYPEIV
jgi:hypothetical protein